MPVFAASALRPFTVRAASSSASVVRMPSALSFRAEKAVKPLISVIGYVMVLDDKKRASSELTEAGGPCDDLSHLIISDFVASETEEFARDALNLAHAEAKSHQPAAERHQAAAHKPAERAAIARGRDRCFRARNSVDQERSEEHTS